MTDRRVKEFKRALKELGIYNLYINSRKHKLRGCSKTDFFLKLDYFSSIIDQSLTWINTGHPNLWSYLYEETKYTRCSQLVKDEALIKRLRQIVEIELNEA